MSTSKPAKKSTERDARNSSPLMTLMGVHPVLPVRFPTLEELATPSIADGYVSSNMPGLFSSLVGDPNVLLDDLLRSPEKYETGVDILLQELASGSKSLSSLKLDEQELLDRATLDLSRSSSKKPEPPSRPKMKSVDPVDPPPQPIDLKELVAEGLDPFWFTR